MVVAWGDNSCGQCNVPALPAGRAYLAISAGWNESVAVVGAVTSPTAYCTAGTTTYGCVASIFATGMPSASLASNFALDASDLEGNQQGLFFYGLDNSGFAPSPWGASYLCVKGPRQRTLALNTGGTSTGCDGSFELDWNAYITANAGALGNPLAAGQHVFAQAWFRDPPSPKTSALSNALAFVLQP
jgi:hypothetical protein